MIDKILKTFSFYLEHPNVKVFMTHSGLLGSQEAIHYGVPMLCLPFAFDQFNNANNYVKKKIAVKVDLKTVTQKELDSALNEILNNPIYKYAYDILGFFLK